MCCALYLSAIIFISISFGIRADVEEPYQPETLTDLSKKVNELWVTLLNGIPLWSNSDRTIHAICNLQPNPKLDAAELQITGKVLFKQIYPNGKLEAVFTVHGFPDDVNQTMRAIHIHSYGDLSNGCDSTGGHFNPHSVNHPGHPGDFGNFRVRSGKIQQHLTNLEPTLFGPFSAIGRSIVVHKLADDLGKGNNQPSLENGNAGTRLACCVIGSTTSSSWDNYIQENASQKSPRVSRRVSKVRKAKN
ncbi:extracellular superoxide dismutase [Cu-Zn] [Bufo gargarizans]|uniref:extracellular superoxide dismutase [Cu-Zn] n=1 Tax=Bufo gargarizans TaxID=30331 RepID=UPI001CF5071F|nr:extracellular superoxide dismutase [Cu-Zn] [Bufo gargarizans]